MGRCRWRLVGAFGLGAVVDGQNERWQLIGVAWRMGAAREQVIERFGASADHDQLVGNPGLGERDTGQLDVIGIVFD